MKAKAWLDLASYDVTRSSTWNVGDSRRAIDGNFESSWSGSSCTHTDNGAGWWQVDLGGDYSIEEVSVVNRNAACDRLNGFEVMVDGNKCDDGPQVADYGETIPASCAATGKVIKTQVKGMLTLCEVQVKASAAATNKEQ